MCFLCFPFLTYMVNCIGSRTSTLYANSVFETRPFGSLLQHMVMLRLLKQLLQMHKAIMLKFAYLCVASSGRKKNTDLVSEPKINTLSIRVFECTWYKIT